MTVWPFVYLISAIVFFIICLKSIKNDVEILAFVSVIFAFVFFAVGIGVGVGELESTRKAKFYNKNFGTDYTSNDFFWNGEEIENMLIGKRVRIKGGE